MTTQQEQERKKYTFHITCKSYSHRHPVREELTFSTIRKDANAAVDRLLSTFKDKTILKVTPEAPLEEFDKLTIPKQHEDWINIRAGMPGFKSKHIEDTHKVIRKHDGTKVCVTSKKKYTRAELMELLTKLEVL